MYLKKILPVLIALFAISFVSNAQVTTSSITGFVKNKAGNALPGATVTAVHVPTNTVYTAVTRAGGRFDINNMNPGGPYTITTSFVGYEADKKDDISLGLGETYRMDIGLTDKVTQLTTVTVAATKATTKNGTETAVSKDKINNAPSVGRGLSDYVRFTPQAKLTSLGGISIAGQNNRYNSFMIDGAVNNDVFGLSDQGTNGGQAGVTPISIDAIDQLAIQVSPYDAAIGNFTGGGINAITKSGSNNTEGSIYYFFRNEKTTGRAATKIDSLRVKSTPFVNKTYGFRLGGAIIKNKLFYFVNAEHQDDNRPQPFIIPTYASGYALRDSIAKLVAYAQSLGYDPGDFETTADKVKRTNINTRVDWNVNSRNKVTASYRYTKAERFNPSRSSNTSINFFNGAQFFPDVTHSASLEFNSKISNKLNNKFRASFTNVVDDRGVTGTPFPRVTISAQNGGPTFNLGSEPSSTANLLKQTIYNFYDAFKWYTGKHAVTIGADIDYNKSYNLFINRQYGLYTYASLDAFVRDLGPTRYQRGYSLVDGNKGGDENVNSAASFNTERFGFFINDDIKVNSRFTLTLGIRADKTKFLTPALEDAFFRDSAAPVISQVYDLEGAVSGKLSNPKLQFSPRVGFRVNLDDENVTIRGGYGIFTGRTPLVWPGGLYQNTGVSIGAVDQSGTPVTLGSPATPLKFRADINNQYTQADFGLPASLIKPQGDINLMSSKFKLPTVAKASIGLDKRLNGGWTISFDALYTKNLVEIDWQNVNFAPPSITTSGPGTRFVYSTTGSPTKLVYRPQGTTAAAKNPYTNVILLKNTQGQQGFAYNFTFAVEKAFRKGFGFGANYTYGDSYVHNEGTSSINTSNWSNMESINGRNFLPLTPSDFDLGSRITAFVSKKFTYMRDHMATTINLFYNGQSGAPFTFVQSGAITGDGVTLNDQIYIPASRAEMDNMVFLSNTIGTTTYTPAQQKDALEAFIQGDKYLRKHRGQFAERNGARLPFTNVIDLQVKQDFNVKIANKRHTITLTWDVANFTNMLNKEWGRQYFLSFDQFQLLQFAGFTGTTPQFRYNPLNPTVGTISDGVTPLNNSRWTGQIGVRYSFQ